MEYRHLISDEWNFRTWEKAAADEFGRLSKVPPNREIVSTETIEFIFAHDAPRDRKVTYARFCCDYRKQK